MLSRDSPSFMVDFLHLFYTEIPFVLYPPILRLWFDC
jgi:hypothetical protein